MIDVETHLLNTSNFKKVKDIDNLVPDESGLYCIRIKDYNSLPEPFNQILYQRNHNIIYIGIATDSLKRRFLNQELRAKGHGTLFRSIGSVLGYRPKKGSLVNKSNKRNYRFLKDDEAKIISWIDINLTANWIEYTGDFEMIEESLIRKYLPLLNIKKNPLALKELQDLRNECVRIANEK